MCSLDYAGYSTVRPGFPLPPEQLPAEKERRVGTVDARASRVAEQSEAVGIRNP